MSELPGSSSGKQFGLSVAKAGLRLIGGSDLADSIADLTGLSTRRIKSLARDGARRLQPGGEIDHEYREVPVGSYRAMESAVVSAFQRAVARDQHAIPVAALAGVDDLLGTVNDQALQREMRDWSQDEVAYAVALAREVARLCRTWYLEDGPARGFATAAGVGYLVRGQGDLLAAQQDALFILRQQFKSSQPPEMDEAIETLERGLAEVGWAWTPAQAGSIRGLDGFMTPADETGALLPSQIPVRLLRGRTRNAERGGLLGPHATREDADILRAHVPGGYFLVYSEPDGALYFTSATTTGILLHRSGKSRDRVRVERSDLLTADALNRIGQAARADRERLAEVATTPGLRGPVVRLFQTLSSAHHVFFEFVATMAFVDPENLLIVHERWAHGVGGDYLQEVVSTMNEYEVAPPVELLKNFPAASLMLTVMRTVVDQLDQIEATLETHDPAIADKLGVPGLRASVAAAISRSYRSADGTPLSASTPDGEQATWLVLNAGHYFMSVALVGLIVDRLTHSLREVVLPLVDGSPRLAPGPLWITYRPSS